MTRHIHVVVGFDFGASSGAALDQAISAAYGPAHVLHIVCVVEPHHPLPAVPDGPVDYEYTDRVHAKLAPEIARHLAAVGRAGMHVCIYVRIGKPANELLRVAAEVGADFIVVGSRNQTGLRHMLAGSIAEKVVREAHCPVLVARPTTYEHVELDDVIEVEPDHTYTPPHRYYYEDHRVGMRPSDWPLY
jgi:universal stress protein A